LPNFSEVPRDLFEVLNDHTQIVHSTPRVKVNKNKFIKLAIIVVKLRYILSPAASIWFEI